MHDLNIQPPKKIPTKNGSKAPLELKRHEKVESRVLRSPQSKQVQHSSKSVVWQKTSLLGGIPYWCSVTQLHDEAGMKRKYISTLE